MPALRKGVDYAQGRPGVAALRAAGASFACRYLSYATSGKNLTAAEAQTLQAGGIDVVSNWEWYGDWAHDYSGGYARGREHATSADRQHRDCGGPPGRPIYFSADFDPTAAQMPTVGEYYRGVASVIGLDRTGAYGGYRTIHYLFDQGLIRWGWQTYAWSGGRWDARAQARQVKNGVTIGGVDCDLDEAWAADFGQWKASSAVVGGTDMALMANVNNGHWYVGDGVFRRSVVNWPEHDALIAGGVQERFFTSEFDAFGYVGRIDADVLVKTLAAIGEKVDLDPEELAAITSAAQTGTSAALAAAGGDLALQVIAALRDQLGEVDEATIDRVVRRIFADAATPDQPPATDPAPTPNP